VRSCGMQGVLVEVVCGRHLPCGVITVRGECLQGRVDDVGEGGGTVWVVRGCRKWRLCVDDTSLVV
jgi:hypothetical protein